MNQPNKQTNKRTKEKPGITEPRQHFLPYAHIYLSYYLLNFNTL